MASINITELHFNNNEFYQELSDQELEVIVGGLNPQPLPPGIIASRSNVLYTSKPILLQGIVIGS